MIIKFIPAVIFGALAMLFALAAIPTRGGVNANAILILPACACFVLAVLAAIIAALV